MHLINRQFQDNYLSPEPLFIITIKFNIHDLSNFKTHSDFLLLICFVIPFVAQNHELSDSLHISWSSSHRDQGAEGFGPSSFQVKNQSIGIYFLFKSLYAKPLRKNSPRPKFYVSSGQIV